MNYLAYFQKTPAILQIVAADGRIVEVSDAWLQRLGYQRSDVIGRSYTHFITTASQVRIAQEYLPRLHTEHRLTDLACDFVHHNGVPLAMMASVATETHPDSALPYYLIGLQEARPCPPASSFWLDAAQGGTAGSGEPFFRRLVTHMTTTFAMRYALVTECINPALTRVRTLAYADQHTFLENLEYALVGTPCGGVIAGSIVYHPEKLGDHFRMDLREEAYLGAPLLGTQGQILGHLALLHDQPKFFGSEQIAQVQNFALQAALALENAPLQRQVMQLAGWKEHGQLARQLHDAVTQSLFSVTLLTAGWQRLLRTGQPIDPDLWLTELNTVSQQALRELRLLAAELQPFVAEKTM